MLFTVTLRALRGGLAVSVAAMLLVASACSRIEEPAPPSAQNAAPVAPPPAEKSTAQTMIDGVTGKTALEAGKRARGTIEKVKASESADMQEAETF